MSFDVIKDIFERAQQSLLDEDVSAYQTAMSTYAKIIHNVDCRDWSEQQWVILNSYYQNIRVILADNKDALSVLDNIINGNTALKNGLLHIQQQSTQPQMSRAEQALDAFLVVNRREHDRERVDLFVEENTLPNVSTAEQARHALFANPAQRFLVRPSSTEVDHMVLTWLDEQNQFHQARFNPNSIDENLLNTISSLEENRKANRQMPSLDEAIHALFNDGEILQNKYLQEHHATLFELLTEYPRLNCSIENTKYLAQIIAQLKMLAKNDLVELTPDQISSLRQAENSIIDNIHQTLAGDYGLDIKTGQTINEALTELVLLDVDKTLILEDGSYNIPLIQALQMAGKTEVVLLTSMCFRNLSEVEGSRKQLIKDLKQKYGITVRDVIVPSDAVSQGGPGAFWSLFQQVDEKMNGHDLDEDAKVRLKSLCDLYDNLLAGMRENDNFFDAPDAVKAQLAKFREEQQNTKTSSAELTKASLLPCIVQKYPNVKKAFFADDVEGIGRGVKSVFEAYNEGNQCEFVQAKPAHQQKDYYQGLMNLDPDKTVTLFNELNTYNGKGLKAEEERHRVSQLLAKIIDLDNGTDKVLEFLGQHDRKTQNDLCTMLFRMPISDEAYYRLKGFMVAGKDKLPEDALGRAEDLKYLLKDKSRHESAANYLKRFSEIEQLTIISVLSNKLKITLNPYYDLLDINTLYRNNRYQPSGALSKNPYKKITSIDNLKTQLDFLATMESISSEPLCDVQNIIAKMNSSDVDELLRLYLAEKTELQANTNAHVMTAILCRDKNPDISKLSDTQKIAVRHFMASHKDDEKTFNKKEVFARLNAALSASATSDASQHLTKPTQVRRF